MFELSGTNARRWRRADHNRSNRSNIIAENSHGMTILASTRNFCSVFVSSVRTSTLLCHLLRSPSIMPFYAVAKGHAPGIYTDWGECSKQVSNFKGPQYKKFGTREEAKEFIKIGPQKFYAKQHAITNSKKKCGYGSEEELDVDFSPEKNEGHQLANSKNPSVKEDGLQCNTAVPPELLQMQRELRKQQKALTKLRTEFESYMSTHYPAAAADAPPSKASTTARGTKRPHDAVDQPDAAQQPSDIKKRILDRPAPDKSLFEVNDEGRVVVYTDGCCWNNGQRGAKAGVGVFFGDDNTLNVAEPVRGRATNNAAEIQAVTYAVELIKRAGFTKALIHTDSQFTINCMTSWLTGWKKKGWKKSDGSPVINKEDLIDLDNASNGLSVEYKHVKGHSGIHGNEMADQLARDGSKTYSASSTE